MHAIKDERGICTYTGCGVTKLKKVIVLVQVMVLVDVQVEEVNVHLQFVVLIAIQNEKGIFASTGRGDTCHP